MKVAWKWGKTMRVAVFVGLTILMFKPALGQTDQGAITGTVEDQSGAVVSGAQVTLKSVDTGLVLKTLSDGSGVYVFSPIKIGNYEVNVSSPGFEMVVERNLRVDLQERLAVPVKLSPGAITQTVTVDTTPSLLQTEQGSIGQVLTTQEINNTPLNGRNFVFIAQLTAGVTAAVGSRGQGGGDFSANGMRAEQNNFLLDGVDNNSYSPSLINGDSYAVRPPPDALAEFKMETSNYNAEYGHSAGAVLNASIKSGTNALHGSLWEYLRNDIFDARDFNALTIPKYRQNQFGATLGFPILKNKLFFFGDVEANRIVYGHPVNLSVPTPLERQGNFSELLNTSLTGSAQAITLYQPNSGGTALLKCNGQQNVFCPAQLDKTALALLNMFPLPNTNGGKTYANYNTNLNELNNTWQWDTRIDWNISPKDQTFARFSYNHVQDSAPGPLGPVLDGAPSDARSGTAADLGRSFALSETHLFSGTLVNEFRFGYNSGNYGDFSLNHGNNIAPDYGLNGVPFGPDFPYNGGLPGIVIGGGNNPYLGTSGFTPTISNQNVYQLQENVTKVLGNHSLKAGVALLSVRVKFLNPSFAIGSYTFSGLYTANRKQAFTGSALADFLADQMFTAQVSNSSYINDSKWYRSGYFQDDWKATQRLSLNLGIRYDYFQPTQEHSGRQGNLIVQNSGIGTGSAVYQIPTKAQNVPISPSFASILATDNIALQYVNNLGLVNPQHLNFAPRFGFSYEATSKTVIRGGFGLFYGGLEDLGGASNLGLNYPFQFSSTFPALACNAGYGHCKSNGLTLEQGFTTQLAQGLDKSVATPPFEGQDPNLKTPYSMQYNLTIERSLSHNLVASVGYVGNGSRHLQVVLNTNGPNALQAPGANMALVRPLPLAGNNQFTSPSGMSNYNGLQTRLEKRYANGLNFLATYTYAHALDNAEATINNLEGGGYRNTSLIPIAYEYANSVTDARHRFTFNGYYELPFGVGRQFMNRRGLLNLLAGDWATSLTFAAQTGQPITVTPNIPTAVGGAARAILVRNPFKAGGSPDPTNPNVTCAPHTRTTTNWFNPCAFANPLPGSNIPSTGAGSQVTDLQQVIAYLGGPRNQIDGPGYERINMSLFKRFTTVREQYLEFRVDAFNVLNTPAYGVPSGNIDSNGGLITSTLFFQPFNPDARFFQFSAKYKF